LHLLKDSNLIIKISNVQHLQDYSFHFGRFKIAKEDLKDLKINKNDYCNLKIDEKKRYQTTLNHTAIHVLNDSVRKFYNNEDSIIQISSSARNENLKFEFLFNKIKKFSKPTTDDSEKIEKEFQSIIDQGLPVFESEIDFDDVENGRFKIRILRDILYPKRVRVVSIGSKFDEPVSLNTVNFHELCCGTHVANTRDLEKFVITSINANGDFTYEIDACIGKRAVEIERNERIINDIYQEICEVDSATIHGLHDIARKCIQIELLTQHWQLSYSFRQKLKKNLEEYRPSKNKLQKYLHKYFHEQILNDEIMDAEDLYLKFITYDSILPIDQTLQALTQVTRIPNSMLIFNQFRKFLIAYSYGNVESTNEHEKLFDMIEKVLKENHIGFEKFKNHGHSNIIVFKFDQRTKPQQIIDICKNIEKI
jgi:alanyl-tRNA synthetase